jgi:hypothetical protein
MNSKMREAEHIARIGELVIGLHILIGKPEGKVLTTCIA